MSAASISRTSGPISPTPHSPGESAEEAISSTGSATWSFEAREWSPGLVVPERAGAHRAALRSDQRTCPVAASSASKLRQRAAGPRAIRQCFALGRDFDPRARIECSCRSGNERQQRAHLTPLLEAHLQGDKGLVDMVAVVARRGHILLFLQRAAKACDQLCERAHLVLLRVAAGPERRSPRQRTIGGWTLPR